MLSEFENVRQVAGEDRRRLFRDKNLELYVWYRAEAISGFQLCYDLLGFERALMWTADHGYSHYVVDGGERSGEVKRTPVFTFYETLVDTNLADTFLLASVTLADEIRDLVIKKIQSFLKQRDR